MNLFLKTFGGAVLKDSSGRVVEIAPKEMGLLVLMRLYAPETRREAVRFLWQGVKGDGGNSLSQALTPLRPIFKDLPKGKGRFVWPGRDQLDCDVDILKRGETDPDARREAIAAYTGIFLKDFRVEEGEEEFRRWVQQRQDEFEVLYRRLWQQEAADAEERRDWARLEALGRRAMELDPYWQPAPAALVRALAGMGDADAAHRCFATVRAQLEADCGEDTLEEVLLEAGSRIDTWAALARSASPDVGDSPAEVPAQPESSPDARAPVAPAPPREAASRKKSPRVAAVLGGTAVLLLASLLLVRGRGPDEPRGASAPIQVAGRGSPAPAKAPFCRPDEIRALLVEQDFKADPANVLPPNFHFTTVWHLQNAGRCTWPASLRLNRVGAKPLSISDRDILAQRVVAPGDTILFPSPMISPPDSGLHSERWQLVDSAGRPIALAAGQRSLAARVRVLVGSPPPCRPEETRLELVTRGYPDDWAVRSGERFTYEWTFMNRSPACVVDASIALRFVASSPARMSDDTVRHIRVEGQVPPSQGYTFEIPMRAPVRDGTYSEQWQVVHRDGRTIPVQGSPTVGLRLRSRTDPAAIPMPGICRRGEYAVAWMATERPPDGTVVPAGGRLVRKWTLANKGTCTWDRGLRVVYVRSEGGRRTIPVREIPVTRVVPPRASYTFAVPIRVPARGSRYREYWSVVDPYGDTAQVSLVKAFWAEIVVAPAPR
jgi:DNA-binding SARP family transcriptional activator